MAFVDIALQLSNAQALTATTVSTSVYDVTGAGSGNAPNMVFGIGSTGGAATAGFDIGLGEGNRPVAVFSVGTTFTAAGAATLTIQIQAAPDNGSNSPGTYTTIGQTGPIALANLTAAAGPLQFPIPPIEPGEALPRFYRFNYVVATGPFTAGTITGNILLDAPSLTVSQYPANFSSV